MQQQYKTVRGIGVDYQQLALSYAEATSELIERLDSHRGALFASNFEYPGRYTCWDIGFVDPPLALQVKARTVDMTALNQRGEALLAMILVLFQEDNAFADTLTLLQQTKKKLRLQVNASQGVFSEEERSRQASVFTVLRQLLHFFKSAEEPYLGLYGALGYDLIFQFEDIQLQKNRAEDQRDMLLYLPDEILIVNHRKEEAFVRRYDFHYQTHSTQGVARTGAVRPYEATEDVLTEGDHVPGAYQRVVELAKQRFACGDLFEVVASQVFYRSCKENPSVLFRRLREQNPSPYGFFINLGDDEYLVGASPEMYVRVQGRKVETCPISGTIRRGANAIEDAHNIQILLDSEKEASELTMCTDVDRNDKSRICEAGSVHVVGRRQIEMYSRLIHTVDHVVGQLREGFDAVDAFLSHMWVVTVTGAPKLWAMNFIERHEQSPRRWYAGAVGWFNFNGDLNSGLVLRTMRIQRGIAEVRVGATLLYDSDPQAEEDETQLKASAFLDLLAESKKTSVQTPAFSLTGQGKRVLLIDHQDSFVHTLANYLRQTGATVTTVRYEHALTYLQQEAYDLVVLSPGPGRPKDFNLQASIETILSKKIPLFGVCLGLQAIVEYFGGSLGILDYPIHGKASQIDVVHKSALFAGLESSFVAGRYHSLFAHLPDMPKVLKVTAVSRDRVVMAIEHDNLPIQAVQFHPETILSLQNQAGLRMIHNLMGMIHGATKKR
jgi:anthranilate synthase